MVFEGFGHRRSDVRLRIENSIEKRSKANSLNNNRSRPNLIAAQKGRNIFGVVKGFNPPSPLCQRTLYSYPSELCCTSSSF
jgi:hypothetical protein